MTVSVVVCAHTLERWEALEQAVASLGSQTVPPLEVVVVVDHEPGLLRRARAAWPDLRVIEASGPPGLAGARNSGVREARGSIVAFLDDDAVAEADWLERMQVGYADPAVACVGGAIEPLWEDGRPRWFPPEFDWVVGCSHPGLPGRPGPVRNPIGANMSFRRSALLAAGDFRDGIGRTRGRIPRGCEETELAIRLRHARPSAVVLHDPAARVRHRVPRSRASWRYFLLRCYGEGLSKAQVARLGGGVAALGPEGRYASRQLPLAVARGIGGAITGDGAGGVFRAGAIVAGLAAATGGFLAGSARVER